MSRYRQVDIPPSEQFVDSGLGEVYRKEILRYLLRRIPDESFDEQIRILEFVFRSLVLLWADPDVRRLAAAGRGVQDSLVICSIAKQLLGHPYFRSS